MRALNNMMIALAAYASAFLGLRMTGILAANATADWVLIAAAGVLAVFLSRPVTMPRSLLIFAATGVLAFVVAVLASYTILNDSL